MKTNAISGGLGRIRFCQVQQTLRFTFRNLLREAGKILSFATRKWIRSELLFDLLDLL